MSEPLRATAMVAAPAPRAPAAGASAVGASAVGASAARASAPRTRLVLGLVLAAGMVAVAATRLWPGLDAALVMRATAAEHALGRTGLVVAAVLQIVVALCGVLPASVGAIAAGATYGVAAGFASAAIGTLGGAACGFALARSLLRPVFVRLIARHRVARRLDELITRDGWRLVCLLRISPVMPFAVTSYALGLTALRWRPYLAGTLASLPALFGYVVLGALSRSAIATGRAASPVRSALLVVAIAALVLLILRLGRIARIAFRLPDGF